MKLITWNIQRGRAPGATCSLDGVVAGLRAFADADVLFLQEVSSGQVARLRASVKLAGV